MLEVESEEWNILTRRTTIKGLEKLLMAKNVTLKMDDSRLHSLNFSINIGFNGDENREDIDVDTDLKYKTTYVYKNKTIHCIFYFTVGGEGMPYDLSIEYEGLFTLNKRIPKKDAEIIKEINCPAILFPFMRECVADITRRAGFAPFMIPSINFVKARNDRLKSLEEK
jgi:preprotein translocase subunit SecB